MLDQLTPIPPTIDEIIAETTIEPDAPVPTSQVRIGRITSHPELRMCIEIRDPIENIRKHGFADYAAANEYLSTHYQGYIKPPSRFALGDDGTLDTVIVDTETNQEHRFNYQYSEYDGDYDSFVDPLYSRVRI